MSKKALYIVLLGGKHEKANIEVHDIIPVICSDLKASYPYLKQQWFGLAQGLHIDGWMKINGVTYHQHHYHIEIRDHAPKNTVLKLFLINLGAYLANQFGEIHKYIIVAGKDAADAKIQGKLAIEKHWMKPHTDAIIDIDDCLELNIIQQQYIHLVEGHSTENCFENDYIVIDEF